MIRSFLKNYRISITAIGPVFIGSGKEISKREWILDRKQNIAYIPDEKKMFRYLSEHNLLKSYEDYMINDKRDLFGWARENGLFPRNIDKVVKYTLDCDGIAQVNTIKGIQIFIKDGLGKPYIPGSSLKGALRNAILAKLEADDTSSSYAAKIRNSASDFKGRTSYLKRDADELNAEYLNTLNRPQTRRRDAVNDIMSGIRVSDSMPLDYSDLTLCQKIDAGTDGRDNKINIFRECIKPGVTAEFMLTIDATVTDMSVSFIQQAISEYLENYNREFLGKFESEELYSGNVIYLGGGAGFHTKTVTSNILSGERDRVDVTANIIMNTVNREMKKKHYKDKALGVSPHTVKLTEYDRSLYQFGPCRISFEPV